MTEASDRLASLREELTRLAGGRHPDPHSVLGAHVQDGQVLLLAQLPGVRVVRLERRHEMRRVRGTDVFAWYGPAGQLPRHYRLSWLDRQGALREQIDPYSFGPSVAPADLAAFSAGSHASAWSFLGAHALRLDGLEGVRFVVWAPHATRVSVVGSFCGWDGRRYPMRRLAGNGIWELFIPGLSVGERYKFELCNGESGQVLVKGDPFARASEPRPATASIVEHSVYRWSDGEWLQARRERDWLHAPMSVYEVHAGSWRRHEDGRFLGYRELAEQLVPYVCGLGYTHVELLPITEHPLDDSWGYQTVGYFAPTSRFGSPDDLRFLVDHCHRHGLGVLLDWVPGHFPRDAHGLAGFDGSPLFEPADPLMAEHRDWGTLVFDYERPEVRAFLISSACYWLEQFHFDGLRVDAVASMLYLDYGRGAGFVPNRSGGRHNLAAIGFLRALNTATHGRNPGTLMMAEESTAWPMVSHPADAGGLGFSMKWSMGWMHDTLAYFSEDPIFRSHHHDKLTFGMIYAYSENFVLPLSHDEVVHLKRSLLGRMPGDRWQRFANLRLLYTYMWTYPGKKLLFMGGELAQPDEWDFRGSLPWQLAADPAHAGVQRLIGDLNRLYVTEPALHRYEFERQGFLWLDCDDAAHSTLSYLRLAGERCLIAVLNLTPVPRFGYRVGVPHAGWYREIFNSDSMYYGGSNLGNPPALEARERPWAGQPFSLELTLPPLGGLLWVPG